MNYLSICAIIQNEGLYIQEWLEHHLAQGVQHFYIYNNDSTDNGSMLIKPYRDKGLVTYYKISGVCKQEDAYNHCINVHKNATEFCAFLDVDEFLYSAINPRFIDLLQRVYDNPRVSVIVAQWLMFGSSGHMSYSPAMVRERFTRRALLPSHKVKSIVRLKDCIFMVTPHTFFIKKFCINEHYLTACEKHISGDGRVYPQNLLGTSDIIRLNHYITKSKEECEIRRGSGRVRVDNGFRYSETFFEENDKNEVEDRGILV